jgi:hypothetical protein
VPVAAHTFAAKLPPPVAAPARPVAAGAGGEVERWRTAVDAVRQTSPRHGASLSYARFGGFTPEGKARIGFAAEHAFHRSSVLGTGRSLIEEVLAKALGRPTQLMEDSSAQALAAAPKSIAEEETAVRVARENSIDHKVRAHPAIRAVERLLKGTLEHVQVLEPVKAERSLETASEPTEEP